ncbi:hypothetical protein UB51_11285 [Paenibacillus sp. IHBB 10380]|nr:hypothetical protein UB51_11285 [Paenibacillus sp. IHBB 10380]
MNLAVILLLFTFGNSMTTTPGSSSGNGNPAILLFVPLIILFVILVFQWVYMFKDKKILFKTIVIIFLVIVSHYIVGVYYQLTSYQKYRIFLAQVYEEKFGYIDWQYINSITTGLSIHINNQYFNFNTYLLIVSLSLFIWLLYQVVKQRLFIRKG